MSEQGKGQGWLPRYVTSLTVMPTSSSTSRATADSNDSPGSTKPASTEKRRSGHAGARPMSRRSSSSMTAMITAGSVRG